MNIIESTFKKLMKFLLRSKYNEDTVTALFQFIQFGIVGLSNTLISYVTYCILVFFHANYLFASIIGFIVSVANAFYWNNKYVFKDATGRRSLLSSFIKTVSAYAGTGLILSNILLIIWVELFHMNELIAPIINLLITIPLNFILNKFWAFKNK